MASKLWICLTMCIMFFNHPNKVSLSESVTFVCPQGQLELTCRIDGTLLTWGISYYLGTQFRYFSSASSIHSLRPLIVNSTTFQFLRNSTSPLISTMVINNVSISLNGTRVNCSDIDGHLVSTTVMNIIETGTNIPRPSINLESEWYGSESVTVTFEWTQERDILYNVTVYPLPVVDYYVGSTRIQITVLYNIQYQVSVSATICEHITTAIRRLHYVSCINPHLLLFSDHLMIKAPQNPVMPGSNVSFSCNVSSELVLTGPNTSTCMPNGEWEPDLRKVACVGDCGTPLINSSTISVWYASNFTTKDSILIYHCSEGYIPADLKTAVCYHNGSWIPDPTNLKCTGSKFNWITVITSAVVLSFIVSLIFAACCICGCCYRMCKGSAANRGDSSNINTIYSGSHQLRSPSPDPVYDYVIQPTFQQQDEKQDFQLKENVVYIKHVY